MIMLALGMFSIYAKAQKKEYKVENDGFEWYKISENRKEGALDKHGNVIIKAEYFEIDYLGNKVFRVMNGNAKYGVIDSNGSTIVPLEYNYVYISDLDMTIRPLITVFKDTGYGSERHIGKYDFYGNCLIPVSREYDTASQVKEEWNGLNGLYFVCGQSPIIGDRYISLCDASGDIIYKSKNKYRTVLIAYSDNFNKSALIAYSDNGKAVFVDQNDNLLWDPHCYTIRQFADGIKVKKWQSGTFRKLTPSERNKIWLKENITKGNATYFAAIENLQKRNVQNSYVSPANTSITSSKTNSSNSNSGNGTTTIVVEHQHQPVPVQEWQACFACGGMGTMGCSNCGGSGTKYIGDRLYTCSRCNGRGIIPCNVCYGNKGQYVTVYK